MQHQGRVQLPRVNHMLVQNRRWVHQRLECVVVCTLVPTLAVVAAEIVEVPLTSVDNKYTGTSSVHIFGLSVVRTPSSPAVPVPRVSSRACVARESAPRTSSWHASCIAITHHSVCPRLACILYCYHTSFCMLAFGMHLAQLSHLILHARGWHD